MSFDLTGTPAFNPNPGTADQDEARRRLLAAIALSQGPPPAPRPAPAAPVAPPRQSVAANVRDALGVMMDLARIPSMAHLPAGLGLLASLAALREPGEWQAETQWLDPSPQRNPLQQTGDLLGLTGDLMNTSQSQIAQPLLGAARLPLARLERTAGQLAERDPVLGNIAGGALAGIASGVAQTPAGNLLQMAAPKAPALPDPAFTRRALAEYWTKAKDGGNGLASFLLEIGADPTSWIPGETLPNMLKTVAPRLGPAAGAARGAAEGLGAINAVYDDAAKLAWRNAKSAYLSLPFVGETGLAGVSKEGKLNQFADTLTDIILRLRDRIPIDMPDPFNRKAPVPSLRQAPGARAADALYEQAMKTRAIDPATGKEIKGKYDPFRFFEQEEQKLIKESQVALDTLDTAGHQTIATDLAAHAQAEVLDVQRASEETLTWLTSQYKLKKLDEDSYVEAVLRAASERLARLDDVYRSFTGQVEKLAGEAIPKLTDDAVSADLIRTGRQAAMTLPNEQIGLGIDNAVREAAAKAAAVPHPSDLEVRFLTDPAVPPALKTLMQDARKPPDPALGVPLDFVNTLNNLSQPEIDAIDAYLTSIGRPGVSAGGVPEQGVIDLIDEAMKPKFYPPIEANLRADINARLVRRDQDVLQSYDRLTGTADAAVLEAGDPRSHAGSPDLAATHEAYLAGLREMHRSEMAATLAERMSATAGRGRWEPYLPDELGGFMRAHGNDMDKRLSELVAAQRRVAARVMEAVRTASPDPAHPIMTEPQIKALLQDPRETLRRLQDMGASASIVNDVQKTFDIWRMNLFAEDPYVLVGDRLRREMAKSLGLNQDRAGFLGRVRKMMRLAENAMQEEALVGLSTLTTNLLGGTAFAAYFGRTAPERILANMQENVRKAIGAVRTGDFKNVDYLPTEIEGLHNVLGVPVPTRFVTQTKNSISNVTGRARLDPLHIPGTLEEASPTAIEAIHPLVRGVLGASEGASMLASTGPVGMALGAAGGAAMRVWADPHIKRLSNTLYEAVEGALRGTRYYDYMREHLDEVMAQAADRINKQLRTGTMQTRGVTAEQIAAWSGKGLDDFKNESRIIPLKSDTGLEVDQLGDLFSPDRLRAFAADAGLSAADASRVATEYADDLKKLAERAVDFSNQTNFDYRRTTNLEEGLRRLMWFPVWPVRATPLFMQMLIENPRFIYAIHHLDQETGRVRKEGGLTQGFQNFLNVGSLGGAAANFIFGRAGSLYLNALRPFAPGTDLGSVMQDRPASNPLQAGLDVAQALGGSLRPGLQIPLEILGAADERPFGLWRLNALKEGLAGGTLAAWHRATGEGPGGADNPERPYMEAKRFLRTKIGGGVFGADRSVGGPSGDDLKDQAVRKRLTEMAYEQTGNPPTVEWLAAMDDPTSPLYRQARADVEAQFATQAIAAETLPVRTRFLPQQEAMIRRESAFVQAAREQATRAADDLLRQGLITPDQRADLIYRATALAEREHPAATQMRNTGADEGATLRRGAEEFDQFRRRLVGLPPATARRLLQEYLASNPEIARYVGERTPPAEVRRGAEMQESLGRGRLP